jgi:hypothetical protein
MPTQYLAPGRNLKASIGANLRQSRDFCSRVKAEVACTRALPDPPQLSRYAHTLNNPCVVARNESGPGSEPATPPTLLVVPLWYRLLCPIRPDRRRAGTVGTRGTLRDASTPRAVRLGAERSLVRIQSPRLGGSPLPKRAFSISGSRQRAGDGRRGTSRGTKRLPYGVRCGQCPGCRVPGARPAASGRGDAARSARGGFCPHEGYQTTVGRPNLR